MRSPCQQEFRPPRGILPIYKIDSGKNICPLRRSSGLLGVFCPWAVIPSAAVLRSRLYRELTKKHELLSSGVRCASDLTGEYYEYH